MGRAINAHEHHDHDRKHKNPCNSLQVIGKGQGCKKRQAKIGPDCEKIAVGEINQLKHSVNHGITKSYKRINAAHGKSVCQLCEKLLHWFLLQEHEIALGINPVYPVYIALAVAFFVKGNCA